MAQRKPVILDNDGYIKELPSGDTISGASAAAFFSANNANAGSIVIGQPVYLTAAGEVDLAQADADGTRRVAGLAQDVSVAGGSSANIQVDGILTATTGQWDTVTGQTGGLTPGSDYILDPDNAGQLVLRSSVIDAGEWMQPVGRAISTTEMLIRVDEHGVKRS